MTRFSAVIVLLFVLASCIHKNEPHIQHTPAVLKDNHTS